MADISKIKTPDGTEYNVKDTTARGLVVANPTLAGTESDLTGLKVNGTKYKIPSGGGSSISPYASNPAMDGTASPGSSNAYARGDHVHPTDTSRAPKSHASSATTYGTGNGSNYGHVKLSDSTTSTSGVSDGIAATPAAVKAAYDLAASKSTLPTVTASDNGKVLMVVNGTWAKASLPVYNGGVS